MRKLIRRHYGGERGFTMLELLIVIIILGILAAVLVPRLMSMRSSGDVAAANTEVANVEAGAIAYFAANNMTVPSGTNGGTNTLLHPPGNQTAYISHPATYYDYSFDSDCRVGMTTAVASITGNLTWDVTNHKWVK